MKDSDCVEFLQWALPRLQRRWPGFRKVRAQVCKRIDRRCKTLGLAGSRIYRDYLERRPAEWETLDQLCPITISCFYRDRAVCNFLGTVLLPQLARDVRDPRALSIGCASGEEPYTLRLAWQFHVVPVHREITLRIVATDVLPEMLERARVACYPFSSLKLLPKTWRVQAFEPVAGDYCLRTEFRQGIEFLQQDVRTTLPEGNFNLILCRNLVFTYFDEPTQRQILAHLLNQLAPGGALVIGRRENLPSGIGKLAPWPGAEKLGIYRRGKTALSVTQQTRPSA